MPGRRPSQRARATVTELIERPNSAAISVGVRDSSARTAISSSVQRRCRIGSARDSRAGIKPEAFWRCRSRMCLIARKERPNRRAASAREIDRSNAIAISSDDHSP
ncbi:Uncharacterised protein [Mycobacteroides abscessus subsp. abscessus]|nr:Uncharacterised protein [Mycobacteroides abscessus subsp. abscessus]